MRVISNLEKKIINRICEGHTHISILLTDHIPDILLSIDKDNEKVELHLDKVTNENQEKLLENLSSQTEKIIYIIKFLLYLENEGYALTGYFSHGRYSKPKIGLPHLREKFDRDRESFFHLDFTDERMNKFIFTYSDLEIFPIHQLTEFKQNNYRTKEDIRHNQIITVTVIAIIISLLLGLTSLIQNLKTEKPKEKHHHSYIIHF